MNLLYSQGRLGGVLRRLCSQLQVTQALQEVHVAGCCCRCSACLGGKRAYRAQANQIQASRRSGFHGNGQDVEVPVYNYELQQVGVRQLPGDLFNIDVRKDILHRVVRWQLAKRQQGTHLAKGRAEVRGGGRKPWKQKGTGRARQGSIRSPQWRGGGVVHGPVLRSHAHDLPKKVRRLGLKCALSAKASEGRLLLLDTLALPQPKTRLLDERLDVLLAGAPRRSVLMGDSSKLGEDGGEGLRLAAANLPWVDVLSQEGLNVYSILQRDHLVLTDSALDLLTMRLRQPIFRGPIDRARWARQLQAAAEATGQAVASVSA